MTVVAVANPKGGVGKSTLATNIAGYYASRGHAVVLGDVDRQQSARLWLQQRPAAARPIGAWDVEPDRFDKPPKHATHAVIDTPAGLNGWRMGDLLKIADKLVVPLQPSVFDIFSTRSFLDELATQRKGHALEVGLVGMRVDRRTLAADRLQQFMEEQGLPVLGTLRPTQNYVHLAAHGLTLFDLAPGRVARDLEQWQGITAWLDA